MRWVENCIIGRRSELKAALSESERDEERAANYNTIFFILHRVFVGLASFYYYYCG